MANVETNTCWDNGDAWSCVGRNSELQRSAHEVSEALQTQLRHRGDDGDPSWQHTAHSIEKVNQVLNRSARQHWIEYGDATCVSIAEWATRQEKMQCRKEEANERRAKYTRFIKQAMELKGGRKVAE